MKVELIHFGNSVNDSKNLLPLLFAKQFFKNYLCAEYSALRIDQRKTNDGYDLLLCNDNNSSYVEIGSYGVRRYKDFIWSYGTGLAEPRTSKAYFNACGGYKYISIPRNLFYNFDFYKQRILSEASGIKSFSLEKEYPSYFTNDKEEGLQIPASFFEEEIIKNLEEILLLKEII